jgi:hypothetical protein
MWVLDLVLVCLPLMDIIEVMNVLQQSEAFTCAIHVVLGSIAEKDEDCSLLEFREESVDLVLSVCFFVLRCYEYVDPRQWLEDVRLVPSLAKFMCNREFHSCKTAAACAIVLWACLGLGVVLEESWVDPLRRRLALLLLQFNEELSLLQASNNNICELANLYMVDFSFPTITCGGNPVRKQYETQKRVDPFNKKEEYLLVNKFANLNNCVIGLTFLTAEL